MTRPGGPPSTLTRPASGIIAYVDPDADEAQVDRVLDGLRVPRNLITVQLMAVGEPPVPRHGRLYSVQEAPGRGEWLAARPVWQLPPTVSDWAGPLDGWTLHIGTPRDAKAGLRLTLQEVSEYMHGLPEDRWPDQVLVYWPLDDGPAWAEDFGMNVHAPNGELLEDGTVWLPPAQAGAGVTQAAPNGGNGAAGRGFRAGWAGRSAFARPAAKGAGLCR